MSYSQISQVLQSCKINYFAVCVLWSCFNQNIESHSSKLLQIFEIQSADSSVASTIH